MNANNVMFIRTRLFRPSNEQLSCRIVSYRFISACLQSIYLALMQYCWVDLTFRKISWINIMKWWIKYILIRFILSFCHFIASNSFVLSHLIVIGFLLLATLVLIRKEQKFTMIWQSSVTNFRMFAFQRYFPIKFREFMFLFRFNARSQDSVTVGFPHRRLMGSPSLDNILAT